MVSKEEMLEKIQEVISDKTLSVGCMISYYNRGAIHDYITYFRIIGERNGSYMLEDVYGKLCYYDCNIKYTTKELIENTSHIYKDIDRYIVIGHDVMIGDVISYCLNSGQGNKIMDVVDYGFIEYHLPIDRQEISCIEYVYSLIKSEK